MGTRAMTSFRPAAAREKRPSTQASRGTMNPGNFLRCAAAITAAVVAASCANTPPCTLEAYHSYDRPAKLPENPDDVRVKVSLSRQRAYVMEGPEMLLVMPVSVGAPETPTPTGHFRILNKVERKRSTEHGFAFRGGEIKRSHAGTRPAGWAFKGTPMPYWCEFKPGLAFHTGWVRHEPCTNGSIRMHENLAPKFFRLVKVGAPVHIAWSHPEDKTHARIPLPPDAGPLPDYDLSFYLGDGYFQRYIPR